MSDQPPHDFPHSLTEPAIVPDWTEQITPDVTVEHLANDRIAILHFENFKPATIDHWLTNGRDVISEWPKDKAVLFCLDVTKIKLNEVRYFLSRLNGNRARSTEMNIYMVLWMDRNVASQLLSTLTRSSLLLNPNTRFQIVNSREDALKWMNFYLKRVLEKEKQAGTVR